MVTAIAPAKVNLFLHVGPVQANGRHPLDSLVVFAGPEAADTLSVEPADDLTLSVGGPNASGLDAGGDNLVMRAAQALRSAGGITLGARLLLEKNLPVAAGIGGGSADAAAALRLLSRLWQLDHGTAVSVAPGLGGDVPVALLGRPALMQGEGERVLQVKDSPPLPALLVNPCVDCPTGPVFEAFDASGGGQGFQAHGGVPPFEGTMDMIDWLAGQRNDLEAPAISRVPQIRTVLDVLSTQASALLTRMSGSGATCFALFGTMDEAEATARNLSATHPDWWVRATLLGAGS